MSAWSVTLPGSTVALAFEPVRDGHAELIHDWMNRDHVSPWWQLDKPLPEVRSYLDGLTHTQPWLVSADGTPFGYVETYRVVDDPLGSYFSARDDDLGWHVLVGPLTMLGTGIPRLLGRAVVASLLSHGADRVICEPDVRNERMLAFCRRLGHEKIGEVDLPDKRAALMSCHRRSFDDRWPGDVAGVAAALVAPGTSSLLHR